MTRLPFLLPVLAFLASAGALLLPTARAQAETQLLADLNREPYYHNPAIRWVHPVETGVVFNMRSIEHGEELWFSDGTPAGTRLLKDITPGPQGYSIGGAMQTGTRVCFITDTMTEGDKLWFTDGTEAGTDMVLDAQGLLGEGADASIHLLGPVDGGLLFRLYSVDGSPGSGELWFSDGTPAGTRQLALLEEGFDPSSIHFQERDGQGYFLGGGGKLWRSDGTADGTVFIVDPATFATEGTLYDFEVADSRFYLNLGMDTGYELWTCSLQGADPVLLRPAGEDWAYSMKSWGDRLAFQTTTPEGKEELWTSDGTPQGTRPLPLIHGKNQDFTPRNSFVECQGVLYFGAYSAATKTMLWRTDGTPEGTRPVALPGKAGTFSQTLAPRAVGNQLYFQMAQGNGDWDLWRTDGTRKGTRKVNSGKGASSFSGEGSLTAVWQDRLFFDAGQGDGIEALWITGLEDKGVTQLTVPEIAGTRSAWADGDSLVEMNGDVMGFIHTSADRELWRINPEGRARAVWRPRDAWGFGLVGARNGKAFMASASYSGEPVELWVTNGTGKGTRRLVRYGPYHELGSFTWCGERLFFRVNNLISPDFSMHPELWVTDGTPKGTKQVTAWDFTRPAPLDGELVTFQGSVYFMARETQDTLALWRSDGTPDGTRRVKEIQPASSDNDQSGSLTVVGDRLSFTVKSLYYQTLWTSDGTEAGTTSYQNSDLPFIGDAIGGSVDLNGIQIFAAKRGQHPRQWYRSDGTAESVQPLMTGLNHPIEDHIYSAGGATVAGDLMFYRGRGTVGGDTGDELWVTDGSVGSPRLVKDIVPGSGSSSPSGFFAVGDVVYFLASTPEHGVELWKSDGTEAGTVLVSDLNPGPEHSYPLNLMVIGGKLYFTAHSVALGRELYVLDLE
jgi:ELWxxDGT repeat protein